ncbi:MAG: hypothetical protein E7627_01110 [Ruminococcaceae bacterium]|nr:hypothetical protein [Oscillospiraceae bacterium]
MARNFKGKAFTKILRGYSPDEVDEYIAYIDGEYKKLEKAHGEKSRRLSLALGKLDEMNNYAEELENQLDDQTKESEALIAKQKQQLILLAKQLEKFANQPTGENPALTDKAKQEAEMIVADAQLKGEKIIAEAEEVARNLREKIITEATARAERIVVEAERKVCGNSQVADDMSLAAVDIYNEICAFRDTLFAAYNTHIESIEEITAAAEVLLADSGGDTGLSYDDNERVEDEPSDDTDELETVDEAFEEEFEGLEELEEFEEVEELEEFEEAGHLEEIEEDFDVIEEAAEFAPVVPIEEAEELYETDFEILHDEEDFAEVSEAEEDSLEDENGFVELTDEEDDSQADDAEDIWAEYFDEAEAEEPVTEEIEEEITPEEEEATPVEEVVEAAEDTYEPYEVYGEAAIEESDESIELEAQKYSDVYADDFDDEDDGSYAPNDEFAWGDDLYAEPTEDGGEDFEIEPGFEEDFPEETEAVSDFEEDFGADFAIAEEAEGEDEEIDELDRLKQFFSANYDEDLAMSRAYDTTSNSTTSIALSLNDFFEADEDMISDFSLDDTDDVEGLFEKLDDPMSVTDEFNIIFGHMDDPENIAQIKRQPIIPAEEPKNPKKHGKF